MTTRTVGFAVVLVLASNTLLGQWTARGISPLPLWADSALTKAGFWGSYDFTSRLSPDVAFADLDGDGLWDVALGIVDKGGRRRGVAIVNQIDRSVHILGAGQPLGNGRNEFSNWDLGALRSEEHTSELQSRLHLVCRLLLEKKKAHAARRSRSCTRWTS